MSRFIILALVPVVASGLLAAAPVPPETKALVAGLSDPSAKVRDESAAALKSRADAIPWLRRATRSTDKDTAKRAAELLAPSEKKRQEAVAKAIDACIRDGRVDLFMEWHHYWKPENKDDLWPVGPRATKAGLDLFAKSCPPAEWAEFEQRLARTAARNARSHDNPCPEEFEGGKDVWCVRTDRMDRMVRTTNDIFRFASVSGPIWLYELSRGDCSWPWDRSRRAGSTPHSSPATGTCGRQRPSSGLLRASLPPGSLSCAAATSPARVRSVRQCCW